MANVFIFAPMEINAQCLVEGTHVSYISESSLIWEEKKREKDFRLLALPGTLEKRYTNLTQVLLNGHPKLWQPQ